MVMAGKQSLIVSLDNQQVCLDLEEKLGQGAFGTVYKAVDNRGLFFAVKIVICQDEEAYTSVKQEIDVLLRLEHPNIVSMYGFELINFSAILIMEYCCKGTLNTRLGHLVERSIQLQWMAQLAEALTYLHQLDIVHRDLKTENILLSDCGDVKIADFGIARPFLCCKHGRTQEVNIDNQYLDAFMGTFAGTPFWIAPEVFDNHYTEKADIFSLGVIFHAICEQQYVIFNDVNYYGVFVDYKGVDTGLGLVMYEQQELIKPDFQKTENKLLKALISSMLHLDPDKRISLLSVKDHINNVFIQTLEVDDVEEDSVMAFAAALDSNTVKKQGEFELLYTGRAAAIKAREKIKKQVTEDSEESFVNKRSQKSQRNMNRISKSSAKSKKNTGQFKIEKEKVRSTKDKGPTVIGGNNQNMPMRRKSDTKKNTKTSTKKDSIQMDGCTKSLNKLKLNESQPGYLKPTIASTKKSDSSLPQKP